MYLKFKYKHNIWVIGLGGRVAGRTIVPQLFRFLAKLISNMERFFYRNDILFKFFLSI